MLGGRHAACRGAASHDARDLERDRNGEAEHNRCHEGELLLFDRLKCKGVDSGKSEYRVIPALKLFPSRRAERAKTIVIGRCQQREDEQNAYRAGVVCQAKEIVAQWEAVVFFGAVDVVEPGASSEMNKLADCRMQNAQSARPDAEVPAEIARHGVALLSEKIPWAHEQRGRKKGHRGVGGGKTGSTKNVFVGTSEIKRSNAEGRKRKQGEMVLEQTKLQAFLLALGCGRSGIQVNSLRMPFLGRRLGKECQPFAI